MASAATGLGVPRLTWIATAMLAGIAVLAPAASAIEFADGRVQIHGFGEIQVRALNEKFKEELDLAQWYNVVNVELEFDIAPDGWGPFDLISAFIRAEGRYDALYSDGFGMFPSLNTFGDDAERLPLRLRDAIDKEYGGQIAATDRGDPGLPLEGDFGHLRIEDKKPALLAPAGERLGFPGYDTFFRNRGPDNLLGVSGVPNRGEVAAAFPFDDPAFYLHEELLDYAFGFQDTRANRPDRSSPRSPGSRDELPRGSEPATPPAFAERGPRSGGPAMQPASLAPGADRCGRGEGSAAPDQRSGRRPPRGPCRARSRLRGAARAWP